MQLDQSGCEGIDDLTATTQKQDQDSEVDLEQHFKKNGLSNQAFSKMSKDAQNGDINVNMLINCNENELNMIADSYKFTLIQKTTFINAVKLLNGYNNDTKQQFIHVYVSPQEQSILDQINELSTVLKQYTNECMKTRNENKNKLETEILKLQEFNKLIQISFNNAINELVSKCRNEISDNEKKFQNLQQKVNKHSNDLKLYEKQFEQYLNSKTKTDRNNNNNFLNFIRETQSNVNKLLSDDGECVIPISIKNSLNVDTFVSQFVQKVNDSFYIEKKTQKTSLRHTNEKLGDACDDNDEKKEIIMDNTKMISKEEGTQQQVANISNYKINKIDWKFNFHYDYGKRGLRTHGIGNNDQSIISSIFFGKDSSEYGKTMKCDWKDGYKCCGCFSTISNNGMKPNSGVYNIKTKINHINNRYP